MDLCAYLQIDSVEQAPRAVQLDSTPTPANGDACSLCGAVVRVGDWPYCPHPRAAGQMGMLGEFKPYLDEHLDQTGKSHWVTSLGQRKRLMKLNSADYHSAGAGMPGCEV